MGLNANQCEDQNLHWNQPLAVPVKQLDWEEGSGEGMKGAIQFINRHGKC